VTLASAMPSVDVENRTLPVDWCLARLGDIAAQRGEAVDPRSSPDLPYVGLEHVEPQRLGLQSWGTAAEVRSTKRRFYPGDVLYGKLRPYLDKVVMAEMNGMCSTDIIVLTATAAALPRFIAYALHRREFIEHANNSSRGINLPRTSWRDLQDFRLPLPRPAEQRRIVAVLDAAFRRLDAAAERLARVPVLIKKFRAAVLSAAVEGRLTEDWRTEHAGKVEPASALLERTLAERRARWESDQQEKYARGGKTPPNKWQAKYEEPASPESDDLPEPPEGWCWATVEQVGDVQGGIQKQPSRTPRLNTFPFLRVANVLRGRLDLADVHRIELFEGEIGRLRLQAGDLLIVEGNGSASEIGRMAVWHGAIDDCVHQNHIIRVRPYRYVLPAYVETYWNSPGGADAVQQEAVTSAGLFNLSVGKINRLPIPLPPVAEQREIVRRVEEQMRLAGAVEARVAGATERVERLRQALLAKAFRGELVPHDPKDERKQPTLEAESSPLPRSAGPIVCSDWSGDATG
jgi:type I restriction enzyme, S subunit